MPIYRVRAGQRHGAHDQYRPGDELELAPAEAAGFLDKLELVELPVELPAGSEPEQELDELPTAKSRGRS